MTTTYRPRNSYCLIRIKELGESLGGVALPDTSIEGKELSIMIEEKHILVVVNQED